MSHTVTIAGSGETFRVGAEESVLAAALAANLNLAHDCKSGTCGTCRVRLVEGAISYREEPMGLLPEEAEAGYALACQARCVTDLVIEAEVQPALAAAPVRQRAIVRGIRRFSADVTHLTLEVPDLDGFSYLPGQHVSILMEDGRPRSFSMASAPNGNRFDLHIRRIPGGLFTDSRLPGLDGRGGARRRAAARLVLPPQGGFPAAADGRHRHRARADQEHPRIADGRSRLPALAPLLGHARAGGALSPRRHRRRGARACPSSSTARCCRAPARGGKAGRATCRMPCSPTSRICRNTPSTSAARRRWWLRPRRASSQAGASLNHIYADSFLFQHNR